MLTHTKHHRTLILKPETNMQLSNFLYDLLYEGKVAVEGRLVVFGKDDLLQSEKILQEFYTEDILHTPLTAPGYSPFAARKATISPVGAGKAPPGGLSCTATASL